MKRASLLLVMALLGCGGSAATTTSSSSSAPARTGRTVIAALETHDGKVSILGGGSDLRVDVTKDDGTVVAENASLDELRTKDPETWMLVKSSVAQSDGAYLDATYVEAPQPTLK